MGARVIRLFTPLPVRLWLAVRIAYLQWRISEAEKDIAYEAKSLWPRLQQMDAWRQDIGAWRVQILILENRA